MILVFGATFGLSSSRRMSRLDDAMPKSQQRIEANIRSCVTLVSDFPTSLFFLIVYCTAFYAFVFYTSRTGRRHDTSRSHHMFCIYGCCTVLILLSLFDMRAAAIEIYLSGTGSFYLFHFFIF